MKSNTVPRLIALAIGVLFTAFPAAAAEPDPRANASTPGLENQHLLPLPDAPVLLVIPDAAAFDQALGGGFRSALTGELSDSDPVRAAWRRTRVGGKLDAEWAAFSRELPLDWSALMRLRPTALGLALLQAGDLEAVLAVRTPLAELPLTLPAGTVKTHRGAPYRLVSRGAGDERTAQRRLGLAWARTGGVLLLATSERALLLALDRALANEGVAAFLPGLASLRLDLPALRKDLYFKREFLFDEGQKGPPDGVLLAALRRDGDRLVEVRESKLVEAPAGAGGAAPAEPPSGAQAGANAATWPLGSRVAAAGWETDGARLFSALRRGLLEPVPSPPERPVPVRHPIPDARPGSDRYLVDLTKPIEEEGRGGEAELPRFAEALAAPSKDGFGWEIGADGARRLVFAATPELEATLASLALETESRRAGRAERTSRSAGGAAERETSGEIFVGAKLPTLAWRRTGGFLWFASRASDLADVREPRREKGFARWGHLDIAALAAEGKTWQRAEGAFSPERTRTFSDRILGLLGFAPGLGSIDVERRIADGVFGESVTFGRAAAAERKEREPK